MSEDFEKIWTGFAVTEPRYIDSPSNRYKMRTFIDAFLGGEITSTTLATAFINLRGGNFYDKDFLVGTGRPIQPDNHMQEKLEILRAAKETDGAIEPWTPAPGEAFIIRNGVMMQLVEARGTVSDRARTMSEAEHRRIQQNLKEAGR